MNNKYFQSFAYILAAAFFFGYIQFCRYLRLGKNIYVFEYIPPSSLVVILGLILFFWPFLSIWIRLILWSILDLKMFITELLKSSLHNIIVKILIYNSVYRVLKFVIKIAYVFNSFLIYDKLIYKETQGIKKKIRFGIFYLSKYSIIFFLIITVIGVIELIITKGYLHYSLYALLILLILRPIFSGLRSIDRVNWAFLCGESDYVNGRWDNPRYFNDFWDMFPLYRKIHKNQPPISNSLNELISRYIVIGDQAKATTRVRRIKLAYKIVTRPGSSLLLRHKAEFRHRKGVRWMFTAASREAVEKWHPMTSLFAKKAVEYAAVMNNSWSHYHVIEQMRKKIPFYELQYKNFPKIHSPYSVSIKQGLEENLRTNFRIAEKYQVLLKPFEKGTTLDSHNQSQDDIVFDFSKGNVKEKRIIGMDQKASTASAINDPSSKILSNISKKEYKILIDNFKDLVFNNVLINASPQERAEISLSLERLIATCENMDAHFIIWMHIADQFPSFYLPPIRVPENFDEQTTEEYIKHQKRMELISKKLKERKVPCDYEEALEFLEGSSIQEELSRL